MVIHKGTQLLSTPRLLLRPFQESDAQDMYDNWANDAHVTRYLTWIPHESVVFTQQLLKDWCAAYVDPHVYNWAITWKDELIGNISVVYLDDSHESASVGYCLGTKYWNQGFMTEALTAVVRFLFSQVGLHRIELCHAAQNPASGKVAQKCGFHYEGTKRECFKKALSGEFWDVVYYGIIRSDWDA